ncbi:DUF302 domain-containing protein [Anoxynatronum buryatiense]|uniref:Uncharacterized conserved protein, DUF302 family n=1 Tax=Anoxynatronum buryatiense TaxID=489973 RepID=A0AA45WWC8_9CLOT|nr:DUF302 domain-containing protein [Anoxynatronum buryatiense]SMP58789.1 Uncharacterized conserved protein, DUF302 family [Anoxynatronum buryatiense]
MAFTYTYTVKTVMPVAEAVETVKKSLQQNGFGTLWQLNVPEKLQEKGVNYQREAVILEVCNPEHARNALEANLQVIYFLPCKVVVFDDGEETSIGMVLPTVMMENLQDTALTAFAREVEETLQKALDEAIR